MSNDYSMWTDEVARQVTGLDPDGQRMQLSNDVLIFFKLGAVEQGALERIAMTDETLWDEIQNTAGRVALGNPEDIREMLHDAVDQMFAAIFVNRGIISKEEGHDIRQGRTTLDDILLGEEVEVEDHEKS